MFCKQYLSKIVVNCERLHLVLASSTFTSKFLARLVVVRDATFTFNCKVYLKKLTANLNLYLAYLLIQIETKNQTIIISFNTYNLFNHN